MKTDLISIRDITKRVTKGTTPTSVGASFASDGVTFVKVESITADGRVDAQKVSHIDVETHNLLRRSVLEVDDLLFTIAGTIGRVARVRADLLPANTNQAVAIVRPDRSKVDVGYLFYALRAKEGLDHARSRLVQSVQANLSLADLSDMEVPLPSLPEQRAIAEVLGALDDKITANSKLAEITDALVRAEYTALSEDVPETRTIASIATHPRDLVDPSQTDGKQIYVGLEYVPRRRMWLSESGLSSDVTSTKASFAKGDVLFGKLRPYFHKVVSAPADGISSTDILVLRAKHPSLAGFLLAAAASDATVERCTAASEGTRMPRTSWKDLAAVEVPWPGESAARWFSARVSALRDRVDSATAENRTLAATRNALLPELMSGRIRVRDAERVVEGVV